MSRADHFTSTNPEKDYYIDFLPNMDVHPITGNLLVNKNENSIKRSIINLLKTNVGDHFYSDFGSNVNRHLFEPNDVISAENIINNIKSTIAQYEKRVVLEIVKVTSSADKKQFNIFISFNIINNIEPITLSFILKRVR